MSFFGQCVIGTLAAVGLICILKTVYDIIFTGSQIAWGRAELYLYGDGTAVQSQTLLQAAEEARRLYLPALDIVFVETAAPDDRWNYAAHHAARHDVTYIDA